MVTESQIKANRRNARKSTGPQTAEGKAAVAQNALKHGLFAHENVIKCEKQADFDCFRDALLAGLKPAGALEAMLAERVVSLSWRLKRAERMSNEVIDVKIAQATNGSWDKSRRRDAGFAEDMEEGVPELILGWATIKDYGDAQVLERLLLYEKRIESSLYKAMNELQKLQRIRKKEDAEAAEVAPTIPIPINSNRDEAATRSEDQTGQNEKQSQCRPAAGSTTFDNSGDFSGCLLPGVVPEILNPKRNCCLTEHGECKTKPIAGLRPETLSLSRAKSRDPTQG